MICVSALNAYCGLELVPKRHFSPTTCDFSNRLSTFQISILLRGNIPRRHSILSAILKGEDIVRKLFQTTIENEFCIYIGLHYAMYQINRRF